VSAVTTPIGMPVPLQFEPVHMVISAALVPSMLAHANVTFPVWQVPVMFILSPTLFWQLNKPSVAFCQKTPPAQSANPMVEQPSLTLVIT